MIASAQTGGSAVPPELGFTFWGLETPFGALRLVRARSGVKSYPSRSWRFPNPQKDAGRGIPCLAKEARHRAPSVIVASANSRFLTELSARFGMTRFDGPAARLKSCPSRSCPLPKFSEGWARGSERTSGAEARCFTGVR